MTQKTRRPVKHFPARRAGYFLAAALILAGVYATVFDAEADSNPPLEVADAMQSTVKEKQPAAVPPIDAAQPDSFETATFGLG